MKILLCERWPVKAELPDGDYACMYRPDGWRFARVTLEEGKITRRSVADCGTRRSGREGIRQCFALALEEGVETLRLSTRDFREVHDTIERCFGGNIPVEHVDKLEFPLEV